MENSETIHVEVAYAKPEEQILIPLDVPKETTAQQAIEKSKISLYFKEIDLNKNSIGIFSKPCALNTLLRDGDRVEIYRPLASDPKEVRRRRAAEGKNLRKKSRF